jgi:hypothetical protein
LLPQIKKLNIPLGLKLEHYQEILPVEFSTGPIKKPRKYTIKPSRKYVGVFGTFNNSIASKNIDVVLTKNCYTKSHYALSIFNLMSPGMEEQAGYCKVLAFRRVLEAYEQILRNLANETALAYSNFTRLGIEAITEEMIKKP